MCKIAQSPIGHFVYLVESHDQYLFCLTMIGLNRSYDLICHAVFSSVVFIRWYSKKKNIL